MKTTAKGFRFWLSVQILVLFGFLFPQFSTAQGTLDALNISSGGTVVGYAGQGVGWSFVPTSDLLVTAINSSASQVDFWLGTSQNIASYNYTGPYMSGQGIFAAGAPNSFQTVPSLLLSAGQIYYVSTQQSAFASSVNDFVYSLNSSGSPYNPAPFSLSPFITQFASYYLSSSGQWSSTTTPASDNVNYAVLGPNFQFQVVPEPTSFELFLLTVGVWVFRRRMGSNFFHDRQTH